MISALNMTQEDSEDPRDRRRHKRLPHGTAVTILVPVKESNSDGLKEYLHYEGWTQNASLEGLNFLCLAQLENGNVIVQTEHLPGAFAEVEILRTQEMITALWGHGCELLRFLSDEETAHLLAIPRRKAAIVPG